MFGPPHRHGCISWFAIPFLVFLALPVSSAPVPEVDDLEVVRQILREISIHPNPLTHGDSAHLKAEDLPRFDAKVLSRFEADRKETALRQSVVHARTQLDKQIAALPLMDVIRADANRMTLKQEILEHQKKIAHAMGTLKETYEELKTAAKDRDKEPSKRWQAHYDYMLARIQIQLGFLYEYQSCLGKVRRDLLPEPSDRSHNAWRLTQCEEEKGDKEGCVLSARGRKQFEKIVKDYPDTPWAELAKRALKLPAGLEWKSFEVK